MRDGVFLKLVSPEVPTGAFLFVDIHEVVADIHIAHVGEVYHLLLAGLTKPTCFSRSKRVEFLRAGLVYGYFEVISHKMLF